MNRQNLTTTLAALFGTAITATGAWAATITGSATLAGEGDSSGISVILTELATPVPSLTVIGTALVLAVLTYVLLKNNRTRSAGGFAAMLTLGFAAYAFANVVATTTTNVDGDYNLTNIPGGSYTLTYELTGYGTETFGPFLLDQNETLVVPAIELEVTSGTATPTPTNTPLPAPQLVINEILADPASGSDWNGDANANTIEDEWIEIYNAGSAAADLTGLVLADDDGGSYTIPAQTLDAGCWAVFYGVDTGIGLGNGGDTVFLYDTDGATVLDTVTYSGGDADDDQSYRRVVDGGSTFEQSPSSCDPSSAGTADCPSPGTSNDGTLVCGASPTNTNTPLPSETPLPTGTSTPTQTGTATPTATATPTGADTFTPTNTPTETPVPTAVPTGAISQLKINEFMADPNSDWDNDGTLNTSGDEWIELYNDGPDTIDLNGIYLGEGSNQLSVQLGPSTLDGYCWLVVYRSEYDFGALNNSGDTIFITAPDAATILDEYTYSGSTNDISERRVTDGADTFGFSSPCTAGDTTLGCPNPGESNDGALTCGGPAPTNTPVATNTPVPTATPTPGGAGSVTDLVINEVMMDPATDWDGDNSYSFADDEWVEIYNTSSNPVDMSGLHIGDDDLISGDPANFYTFAAGTIIPGNGFIVIYGSDTDLAGDDIGGGFSNGGDTAVLYNTDGTVLNSTGNIDGSDDQSFARVPDGSGTFVETNACTKASIGTTDCPSPGQSNAGGSAPTATPTSGITATATPTSGSTATATPTTPAPTATPTSGGPTGSLNDVVVNELMIEPTNYDWDNSGTFSSSGDEWIELYNTSSNPVDLSGAFVGDDDSAGSSQYEFPAGTTIAGNGYIVVYGSDVSAANGNSMGAFGNSGDSGVLYDTDGTTVIDSLEDTTGVDDASYRRLPDGDANLDRSDECAPGDTTAGCPSPGSANLASAAPTATPTTPAATATPTSPAPTATPTTAATATPTPGAAGSINDIIVTEFMNDPNTTEDWAGVGNDGSPDGEQEWIEIHNPTGSPIDITGCFLGDNDGSYNDSAKYEFPATTTIPAGGYIVIYAAQVGGSGFGLANGGDNAVFYSPTGTVISDSGTQDASDGRSTFWDGSQWLDTSNVGTVANIGNPGYPSPGVANPGN